MYALQHSVRMPGYRGYYPVFQYRKRYVRVATSKEALVNHIEKCFNTASGMYALQHTGRDERVARYLRVSIPQAVCTRCNFYLHLFILGCRCGFQYRKRYVRVATVLFDLHLKHFDVATVSIPQAVCTRCNVLENTVKPVTVERFQYRKRYVRVATL